MSLADPDYVENVKCNDVSIYHVLHYEGFADYVKDMVKLCYDNQGIGLAAPQVGLPLKMFVAFDIEKKEWNLFLNPNYTQVSEEQYEVEEACLTYGHENKYRVKRYAKIIASWSVLDLQEQMLIEKKQEISSIAAQIFQHETDHCYGKTIAMIGQKI